MENQPELVTPTNPLPQNPLPPTNPVPPVDSLPPTNPINPQVQMPQAAPTEKHKTKRIIIGVVIALIAFVLIIAGTVLLGSQQIKAARKASDQFIHDMDTNSPKDAYALTTPSFHQFATEASLASSTPQIQQHLKSQPVENSWHITNQTGQPQTAVITYTAQGASLITVTLQKINGTWLVLNFKYDFN